MVSPFALGSFGQGLASAFNKEAARVGETQKLAQQKELQEKALGIQKGQLDLNKATKLIEQADKGAERSLAAAKNIISKITAEGGDVSKIPQLIQPLRGQFGQSRVMSAVLRGMNPREAGLKAATEFDALMQTADPNKAATQAGKVESQKNFASMSNTATALNVPIGDVAKAKGVIPKDKSPSVKNFKLGDKFFAIDMNAPGADKKVSDALKKGAIQVPVSVQAGDPSVLTKSTTSKLQDKVANLKDLTVNLAGLVESETSVSGARGFLGVITEYIINKGLAQINPAAFNKDVASSRQLNRQVRESALRVVSSDTRFNKDDREYIQNLFPKDGVFESKANAIQKVKMLSLFFENRLAIYEGQLGKDTSPMTGAKISKAARLNWEQLKDAFKKGEFRDSEFKQIAKVFHPEIWKMAGGE